MQKSICDVTERPFFTQAAAENKPEYEATADAGCISIKGHDFILCLQSQPFPVCKTHIWNKSLTKLEKKNIKLLNIVNW